MELRGGLDGAQAAKMEGVAQPGLDLVVLGYRGGHGCKHKKRFMAHFHPVKSASSPLWSMTWSSWMVSGQLRFRRSTSEPLAESGSFRLLLRRGLNLQIELLHFIHAFHLGPLSNLDCPVLSFLRLIVSFGLGAFWKMSTWELVTAALKASVSSRGLRWFLWASLSLSDDVLK